MTDLVRVKGWIRIDVLTRTFFLEYRLWGGGLDFGKRMRIIKTWRPKKVDFFFLFFFPAFLVNLWHVTVSCFLVCPSEHYGQHFCCGSHRQQSCLQDLRGAVGLVIIIIISSSIIIIIITIVVAGFPYCLWVSAHFTYWSLRTWWSVHLLWIPPTTKLFCRISVYCFLLSAHFLLLDHSEHDGLYICCGFCW